jgi:hypothetical protein
MDWLFHVEHASTVSGGAYGAGPEQLSDSSDRRVPRGTPVGFASLDGATGSPDPLFHVERSRSGI